MWTIFKNKNKSLRPTTSKVKSAIFSLIGPEGVKNQKILDLYAGTGNLGIECLNRGAKFSVFVEKNIKTFKMLKKKLEEKQFQNSSKVFCLDAIKAVKKIEGPFDIIFADPPYNYKNISEVLILAEKNNLFHDQSLIFYEHSKNQKPLKNIGNLSNIDI